MARHSRVVLADVALHITQRGNNRQDCFRHDTDRLVYLASLRALCRQWECALHAYCLMTNHVHLLVTPKLPASCALLMRDLGRAYVPYFNRRHGRTGSLWEGRFRSCLVDSASHVLACHRYIELNPVRAAMVRSPRDYAWSSFNSNSGVSHDPALTLHAEFEALGIDERTRTRNYIEFVGAGDDPAFLRVVRQATGGGYPLAGEELKARLLAAGYRIEPDKPGPRARAGGPETPAPSELELFTGE
jgi:REP-associated tyrosine transposase